MRSPALWRYLEFALSAGVLSAVMAMSGPGILEGSAALSVIGAEPDCDTLYPCFNPQTCKSSGGTCLAEASRCRKSTTGPTRLCNPLAGASVCKSGPCVMDNNDTCSTGCKEGS